jgi:hypothetical protein
LKKAILTGAALAFAIAIMLILMLATIAVVVPRRAHAAIAHDYANGAYGTLAAVVTSGAIIRAGAVLR